VVLHGSRAASAGRPILTIKSNRRNYAHARNCLSSTSRAAFSCSAKCAEAYSYDGACKNWVEEFFSRIRRAEIGCRPAWPCP
jgi:hypothetical protein